jgi:DNA polymerase-3 subunit alpha
LASFTKGDADTLRKAMGKKIIDATLDKMKPKFIEGCKANGIMIQLVAEKVWKDWEAFAVIRFQ